jgi:hypothetical protein
VKPADPADWVDEAARQQPERVFLRTETGRELNYAALRAAYRSLYRPD